MVDIMVENEKRRGEMVVVKETAEKETAEKETAEKVEKMDIDNEQTIPPTSPRIKRLKPTAGKGLTRRKRNKKIQTLKKKIKKTN